MNKELQKALKFLTVGVSNVAIDIGVFNFLIFLNTNLYFASTVSFTIAALNSFIHNRRWTFDDGRKMNIWLQYLQFMAANVTGYFFNTVIIYWVVNKVDLGNDIVTSNAAKLAAIGLVVIWNYSVARLIIFRPEHEDWRRFFRWAKRRINYPG